MSVFDDLYLSCASVVCYDEGDVVPPPEGDLPPVTGEEPTPPEGFTPEQQRKFNEVLAAERRKQEAKLKAEIQKRENTLKEMLQTKSLTEKERNSLEEQLAVVSGQLRTEKNASTEKIKELENQWTAKLQAAEKRAEAAEIKYRSSTITRALQDAAVVNDAFRPEQIVTLLTGMTKLVDDKVVVELPDEDANTGDPIMTTRSPEDAVKRMKEKPEVYGNLFKSNVVSGIASNSATGGATPGQKGKIDVRNLTPAQYREIRAKNPELLGLGTRKP